MVRKHVIQFTCQKVLRIFLQKLLVVRRSTTLQQKWIRNVSNKIDKKKQKENKNVLKNCTFKPVINSAYISDITNAKVKNDCTYKENKYSMMKVKNQAKTSKYNRNQPKTIKYSASYSNVNGTKSDVTNIRKEYGIKRIKRL